MFGALAGRDVLHHAAGAEDSPIERDRRTGNEPIPGDAGIRCGRRRELCLLNGLRAGDHLTAQRREPHSETTEGVDHGVRPAYSAADMPQATPASR